MRFVYKNWKGLTLETDQNNDAIIELYEIGKTYSEYRMTKRKSEQKLVEAENKLLKYIENFGFFFSTPENKQVEYKSERLLRLAERIFMTMVLKQEINAGMNINYNRVFESTFFFIFSIPPMIEYYEGEETRALKMKLYSIQDYWMQESK